MEGTPLRVALLGFGTGGSVFHAPLITAVPGLTLAAVVTTNPRRREELAARYPGTAVLDSADQVWQGAGDYDLAVITVPNRQHVPLARQALQAGLPAVVDKPVAVTPEQARELAALAAERNLPLIPFHNRRWDGDFKTAKALIEAGELGGVLRLESRFERWRPQIKPGWKESADPADAGSILYDLGSHLIDQAVALFGRPLSVHAEIDTRRAGAAVADDIFLSLMHRDGVRAHLWASATAAQLGPRFRVLGDRAAYTVNGLDGQEDALRAGHTPSTQGWGQADPADHGLLGTPGAAHSHPTLAGSYQDFYTAVAATLTQGSPPPVTMQDAITGLDVIAAALASAEQRRTITLDPAV